MKKVLAFAGSNSSNSVNQQLVKHAAGLLKAHEITVINLTAFDAPIFSEDLEKESGVPENILKLKELFNEHDAYMIASPEHNGMMPAFFKNITDWLSRSGGKTFQGKPVMLMSTSPGGGGGKINLANMKAVFPNWGASAVFADFSLGSFYQAYNSESQSFTESTDEVRLRDAVQRFESHLTN